MQDAESHANSRQGKTGAHGFQPSSSDRAASLGRLAAFGAELAIVMSLCVLAGYRADARHGGGMRRTLAGAAVGTAFWIYQLWNLTRGLNGREKRGPEER